MTIYIIQQRINDDLAGATQWETLWATQDEEQAQSDIRKLQTRNNERGELINWEYKITESTLY